MLKINLIRFASLIALMACDNPLEPLDRNNQFDPNSPTFTPKDSFATIAYESDLGNAVVVMYSVSEFLDGFHLQKSTDQQQTDETVWEDLGKINLPERQYTDTSKRFSPTTKYRVRSFKKVPNDTSYSSWTTASILFSSFTSRLAAAGNTTFTWSKHHPLIETYHVYYTVNGDSETKRELTVIEENKPTYSHTFSQQMNEVMNSSSVVVEGYVNDGEIWHMVTKEVL